MGRYLLCLTAAVWGLLSSCSDEMKEVDTTPDAAVGIVSVAVIPDSSAISYEKFEILGDTIANVNDSVRYEVKKEALQKALVMVKATLFGEAYYNNVLIPDSGVVMDVTEPVRLEARSGGRSAYYVLKVLQRQTEPVVKDSIPVMEKMASGFKGFPANVIDYDVAYFKDKFYATVTSYMPGFENGASVLDKKVNYDLYTSADGLNWEQVVYKTNTEGVRLPRPQREYVVGGEGASLAVFNDRLYVLGGARTSGRDRLGNKPELIGVGETPTVSFWRSFSTADGETFDCDTVGMTMTARDSIMPSEARSILMGIFGMTPMVFKDKMYLFSPYKIFAGVTQSAANMYCTENGKDWTMMMQEEGSNVSAMTEASYFVFNDSLWCVGGARSFIGVGTMSNGIYASGDGENWIYRGMVPDSIMGNVYGMKAVATDSVIYLFGGQKQPMLEGEIAGFAPNQVFRSTDAVNWEVVKFPENFTPIRRAKVVSDGEKAWIFGGVSSPLTKSIYAYPSSADTWSTEVWTQILK